MFLQATDVMPVSTELPALISTSALSVAIIQWFKNSDLPIFKAFNQQSSGLNRTVAWLAAIIAGVGIHYQYDASAGSLTITGLTVAALWHTGMDSAKSYAFNWLIYNTAVKGKKNKPEVATTAPAVPVASVAPATPKID
jgi:hypothetical protein